MDKRDNDNDKDDGIVAEDVTQLVEHIELTGPQRLMDTPGWELATPVADLDDAPIMLDDVDDGSAGPESLGVSEDNEFFTETQYDLGRHLPDGQRIPADAAAASALAAERARWQKRVDSLLMSLAERDQLLAERERRIEELSARLATRTLEREGIALELRDARRDAGLPEGDVSMPDIGAQASAPAGRAAELASPPSSALSAARSPAAPARGERACAAT
jgi:hypothetical protein